MLNYLASAVMVWQRNTDLFRFEKCIILTERKLIMQIEKLNIEGAEPFICFMCQKKPAEYRHVININNAGKLIICLCESCSRMPETEIYAHFMTREGEQ